MYSITVIVECDECKYRNATIDIRTAAWAIGRVMIENQIREYGWRIYDTTDGKRHFVCKTCQAIKSKETKR